MTTSSTSAIDRPWLLIELLLIVGVCFIYAGDAPPGVNEAHYLVKAKNFWQPDWCANDLFAASGKAHATFYCLLGWPTRFVSLASTAWIGRLVGWTLLAMGLMQIRRALGMPMGASIAIAVVWIAGIEHGNLAGEWVIGGIEAKVPAYGLVLCGVADMIRRRWSRVWVWFGSAAAIHVLTGGWSVVAGFFAFAMLRLFDKTDRQAAPWLTRWLFLGGLISLAGVVPAAAMSWGSTPDEAALAADTYTNLRISHHLLPSAFPWQWYRRHGVLAVLTLLSAWSILRLGPAENRDGYRILFLFTTGAFLISLTGLCIGVLPGIAPELKAKLLRFYWFRLSDAIVPLALACAVAGVLTAPRSGHGIQVSLRLASAVAIVIAAGLMLHSTYLRMQTGVPVSVSNRLIGLDADADYAKQRRVMRDWVDVCRFIRASTPPEEVLLTPRHQQTFKWYAHRAEVVNWKDIPQDTASLVQWRNRFAEVYPAHLSTMRVTISYAGLRRLQQKYQVRWMVVDRRVVGQHLPLVQVYPTADQHNSTYAVYRLPSPMQ